MKVNPEYVHFAHLEDYKEFEKRFEVKIQQMNMQRAYNEVEDEYRAWKGENRYSSFHSFYIGWNRRQKRKLEKAEL